MGFSALDKNANYNFIIIIINFILPADHLILIQNLKLQSGFLALP